MAVILFVALTARFWDPCYGFTKFLQFDSTDYPTAVSEMRRDPVYVYPGEDGYDGFSYAEIAYHPLLNTPQLKPALGNVPYRARRILASAAAFVLAGGSRGPAAAIYAALNLAIWPLFALLAWRLLPVRDGRSYAIWLALVFTAGALHSVRLALTDLLGVTLFAFAMLLSERGKRGAWALLALGGLARETILGFAPAWWHGPWTSPKTWLRNLGGSIVAGLPLLLWMAYVRRMAGAAPQGIGNFTWPISGWVGKWSEILAAFREQPQFLGLELATFAAFLGLTVHAAYFLLRPRPANGWWRAGMAGVLLMVFLGPSVWEGNPGAALRVLLPMSFAFAVLLTRDRASWGWIVAGALPVVSGIIALATVPAHPREIATGRTHGLAYAIGLGDGCFGAERAKSRTWSWVGRSGVLTVKTWPRDEAGPGKRVAVALGLRALTARNITVQQDGQTLWQGGVGPKLESVTIPGVALAGGPLDLSTDEPLVAEGTGPRARELGFAIYDPRVVAP